MLMSRAPEVSMTISQLEEAIAKARSLGATNTTEVLIHADPVNLALYNGSLDLCTAVFAIELEDKVLFNAL